MQQIEPIEATGLIKNNKEPLKSINERLETDGMCEVVLALKLTRQDYLRLVRAKNMEQAVLVKIAIPQEQLDLGPEFTGEIVVEPPVESTEPAVVA